MSSLTEQPQKFPKKAVIDSHLGKNNSNDLSYPEAIVTVKSGWKNDIFFITKEHFYSD